MLSQIFVIQSKNHCKIMKYFININIMTSKKPIINAMVPASMESFPKSGPTVLSSIIDNGAGRAPDLSNNAKS